MRRRPANFERPLAPTAPRRRPAAEQAAVAPEPMGLNPVSTLSKRVRPVASPVVIRPAGHRGGAGLHPLSNGQANAALRAYEQRTLGAFDRIVPVLKRLSALQHEGNFVAEAQRLALAELGHELPLPVLEQAWTSQLDMRTLFAWCVFEAYEQTSLGFFNDDIRLLRSVIGNRHDFFGHDFHRIGLKALGFAAFAVEVF